MRYSVRMTERDSVVGVILPVAAIATALTDVIDLSKYERVTFYVIGGAKVGSATVDFKVRWCATSGGTYADLAGAAIVQDTAQSLIHQVEVTTEKVSYLNPTARFILGSLTVAVGATPCSVLAIGSDASYEPVTMDAAAAGAGAQIVVVS